MILKVLKDKQLERIIIAFTEYWNFISGIVFYFEDGRTEACNSQALGKPTMSKLLKDQGIKTIFFGTSKDGSVMNYFIRLLYYK